MYFFQVFQNGGFTEQLWFELLAESQIWVAISHQFSQNYKYFSCSKAVNISVGGTISVVPSQCKSIQLLLSFLSCYLSTEQTEQKS